jgi:hypothetical protein
MLHSDAIPDQAWATRARIRQTQDHPPHGKMGKLAYHLHHHPHDHGQHWDLLPPPLIKHILSPASNDLNQLHGNIIVNPHSGKCTASLVRHDQQGTRRPRVPRMIPKAIASASDDFKVANPTPIMGQLPLDSGQFPLDSGQFPLDSGQLPLDGSISTRIREYWPKPSLRAPRFPARTG